MDWLMDPGIKIWYLWWLGKEKAVVDNKTVSALAIDLEEVSPLFKFIKNYKLSTCSAQEIEHIVENLVKH